MSELGKKIRKARKDLKLSQEKLGQQVGVSRVQVNKWESGKAEPVAGHLRKLAEVLKVSASWLLMLEEVNSISGQAPLVPLAPSTPATSLPFLKQMVAVNPWGPVALEGSAAADEQDSQVWDSDVEPGQVVEGFAQNPRAVLVRGNSASEFARDGQVVVVDVAVTRVRRQDLCVVVTKDGCARLKRKIGEMGGLSKYESINPAYPNFEVHTADVLREFPVCAVLVGSFGMKTLSTVDEEGLGQQDF